MNDTFAGKAKVNRDIQTLETSSRLSANFDIVHIGLEQRVATSWEITLS